MAYANHGSQTRRWLPNQTLPPGLHKEPVAPGSVRCARPPSLEDPRGTTLRATLVTRPDGRPAEAVQDGLTQASQSFAAALRCFRANQAPPAPQRLARYRPGKDQTPPAGS